MAATREAPDSPRRKGFFGIPRFPVAKAYLYPEGRNRLWLIGTGLALLVGGGLLADLMVRRGALVSNGPLSSVHAGLETTCVSCHTPFQPVSNQKCRVCHEKFTDSLGTYTFNAHYVYLSGDRTRAFGRSGETSCIACHMEHTGRDAALTAVPDSRCAGCHIGSFAEHPQFGPALDPMSDDANLTFGHIRHVERVMDDRELSNHELACLTCHTPTADGTRFEPISFADHCAGCHLGPDEQSEPLEVSPPGVPLRAREAGGVRLRLGVEALGTVRARRGPGEDWALSMSPAAFDGDDEQVTKIGIQHRDPWILHNLRRLRRVIYPDGALSDLLVATPEAAPSERRAGQLALYEEALATLEAYAAGLRGEPDFGVQDELADIERTLNEVRARLDRPDVTLSVARFRSERAATDLTPEQLDTVEAFAAQVARPCLTCHRLERATIARVQPDQRTMPRARFNHRAHVLQRDCLSCHDRIPFFEYLGTVDAPSGDESVPEAVDTPLDGAQIHNLPRVEQCQTCHAPSVSSDRCVTCHDFHPVKDHLSRLVIE